MYSDDTTLCANIEDFNSAHISEEINSELHHICTWLLVNKLKLNVDKTKCMIFQSKNKHISDIVLTMDNSVIQQTNCFNFLGLTINNRLTWRNHSDMISNKISKVIGIISRLRMYYPQRILLTIYNSLIVPHMNYCLLSWGTFTGQIEKLQKKALRIISFSNRISHTEPICKALDVLNIRDMYKVKQLKFYFKLCNNNLPSFFDSLNMSLHSCNDHYNFRHRLYTVPKIKHEFAKQCLRYQLACNLNVTGKHIIDKVYTHSMCGFSHYIKYEILTSYNDRCTIRDCFVCSLVHP
jgi:hypothetical protein